MTPIIFVFFLATLPHSHSIIGGVPGQINSYPYVVSITRNLEDTKEGLVYIGCGGVLLTVDWIITAGSCINLDEIDARQVIIAAGSNFEYAYMKEMNSLNAKNVQIRDAVKGVRYEPELYFDDKYDIGLIKVEPSFKIVKGSVDLVFVPNSKSKEWMTKCKHIFALGWGQNIIESIAEQITTVSPNQNYTNSTFGNQNDTSSTIETQTQNYTTSTAGNQNQNYTNSTLGNQNLNSTNSTLVDQSQNQTIDSNVTQSEPDPYAPIRNFDPHLQIVDLKLSEVRKCASSWPDYYEDGTDFRDFIFCTDTGGYGVTNNETKGVCSGDEGGPIVCHGIVVGIISHLHNDTCSKGNMTQIHAKIDAFYDFFEKIAEVKMPYRLNSKFENSRAAKEDEGNVNNKSVDFRSDYGNLGINFVELENTLEQEQEALVNKLWKRMDKLEAEKRMLQIKLDQPVSDPASPRDINNGDTATNLSAHIQTLRSEVARLRQTLAISQQEHTQKMQRYAQEERNIKEENLRLQRKLQLEVERREALCRHLSESESSLEMEEERHYNEQVLGVRQHTVSPVPYNPSPSQSRPLSPGLSSMQAPSPRDSLIVGPPRCPACGQLLTPTCVPAALHAAVGSNSPPAPPHRRTSERFIKPAIPAPQPASPMDTSTITKE